MERIEIRFSKFYDFYVRYEAATLSMYGWCQILKYSHIFSISTLNKGFHSKSIDWGFTCINMWNSNKQLFPLNLFSNLVPYFFDLARALSCC